MQVNYDYAAAKKAGLSDEQINEYLNSTYGDQSQPAPEQSNGLGDMIVNNLPTIGAVAGSFIPGVGLIGGGALGAGAGEAAKELIKGKGLSAGDIAKEAALGGVGGVVGKGIGAVGKAVLPKITEALPERLMNSVYREPSRASKAAIAEGETLGKQALNRGQMGTTESLYKTASKQIDNTESTLQETLMNTDHKVPMTAIKKEVQPLIDKYRQAGNEADATALESRLTAIEAANGGQIPAAAANALKRSLYDEAQKAYGTQASANMEGIKAIARGIKQNLEKVPGVSQLNKDLSFYGRQRNSMIDKMSRDQRNNMVGLTNTILTGGGLAAAPATGGLSLAIPAASATLGTTVGKTSIAQGLKTAGKIAALPPIQAAGQVAAQTAGQTGVRLPVIDNGTNSQPDQKRYENNQFASTPSASDSITNEAGSQVTLSDGTVITPASIRDAYINDLQTTGGKNAAKIESAYKFLFPDSANKPLSGPNSVLLNKAQTATKALDRIETMLKGDPNAVLKKLNPLDQSGRQLGADITSAIDLLAYFRTGATITPIQRKDYVYLFPSVLDDPATRQQKIDNLRAEFQGYINGLQKSGGTVSDTGQSSVGATLPAIQ